MSKLVTLKQNVEFNHAYNRGKVRISPASSPMQLRAVAKAAASA